MCPRNHGFTLVELLLGLGLAAIISLSAYNLFWTSVKFDDRMRHMHKQYLQVLMADYSLSLDLENAISLDLSQSYPDSLIFEGSPEKFSFLTQTSGGIKRVTYYSGNADLSPSTTTQIGRVTNPSGPKVNPKPEVNFLLRMESSLADWLNETHNHTSVQIIVSGLKKDSWHCQYAPYAKDLPLLGAEGIDYQDSWDKKDLLPMGVRCSFTVYDPNNKGNPLEFKRDIFLAPIQVNQ